MNGRKGEGVVLKPAVAAGKPAPRTRRSKGSRRLPPDGARRK
jgi:hypothetical protein